MVKTLVGRPMQVAIVNGLKRKLEIYNISIFLAWREKGGIYAAAIAKLLHRLSFLGDVNSFDDPASPESAIFIRALALRRWTRM